jgi:hypothetical protein
MGAIEGCIAVSGNLERGTQGMWQVLVAIVVKVRGVKLEPYDTIGLEKPDYTLGICKSTDSGVKDYLIEGCCVEAIHCWIVDSAHRIVVTIFGRK